ncbi:MAG: sigma-70 family RNA polymerase sigma factor [Oceanospirillaceae bacterium]|nr:sigma-70 family RNA polymerase sigma factor [Oceanospirillaceae bacterium]
MSIEQLPYITSAYTELVKRYESYVFSLCYRYLSVRELAEDAAQDVFLKIFHALPKFEFRAEFKTWLYRITINHCNSLLHKLRRDKERFSQLENFDDVADDQNNETAQCVAKEDDNVCVHEVINALQKSDRDLILLRFNNDLALKDISEIIDKKLSATKMNFYRALDKFKQLYQKLCL